MSAWVRQDDDASRRPFRVPTGPGSAAKFIDRCQRLRFTAQ
jgi:hypothetical protein